MRVKFVFLISLIFSSITSFSKEQSIQADSLTALLRDVFGKVKQNSVFRKKVNWEDLEHKVFDAIGNGISEVNFKNKVRLIFTTIGDKHGAFYYNGERLGNDRTWTNKLRIPTQMPDKINLKTALLEDGYGYLLLPPNNNYDIKTCQQYQDSLCSLGIDKLKGLIIDLRLQEGGSIFPLFSGLNQVYGAKYFGSNRDLDGNVFQKWSVSKGEYGRNQIYNRCKINNKLKIVVLTSQITASAGEIMAVALKGRPKTFFIGEPTAGLSTMNVQYHLGKNILVVAASVPADRNGTTYGGNVLPDLTIIDGDDFTNLSVDKKVIAALRWMKK